MSQAAHRNVVFAWQSGHRPLQRGVTYGLDGAFLTRLQPQLLELYEWASTRWYEFLHLPSKIAGSGSHQAQSYNHLGTSTRSLDKALPFPPGSTEILKLNQPSNNQYILMDEDEASDLHSLSSWMPSPPPKRRRINHRTPSPQPQPQPPVISLLYKHTHNYIPSVNIQQRRGIELLIYDN